MPISNLNKMLLFSLGSLITYRGCLVCLEIKRKKTDLRVLNKDLKLFHKKKEKYQIRKMQLFLGWIYWWFCSLDDMWWGWASSLRLSWVQCDFRLILMFLRCKKECSCEYVETNTVSKAILKRCSMRYVAGSAFPDSTISWLKAFSFLFPWVFSPTLLAVAQVIPNLYWTWTF